MKKLQPFKDEHAKLSGNFTAEMPFGRVFRSCETTLWHTSAILQHSSPHFEAAKWSAKMPFCCKMISKLQNGCEITSKHRNGLQIAKLTCKMEGGLQKHLAKPREVAKMPTEPCDHAYEEESPAHPEITHTKPLTPLLTSLNHQIQQLQLRAPVEETMPPKETTRTEVKVLIQPIQEATTDASAPHDPTTT